MRRFLVYTGNPGLWAHDSVESFLSHALPLHLQFKDQKHRNALEDSGYSARVSAQSGVVEIHTYKKEGYFVVIITTGGGVDCTLFDLTLENFFGLTCVGELPDWAVQPNLFRTAELPQKKREPALTTVRNWLSATRAYAVA